MIKALLFDLDGTLFDSSAANVHAYTLAFQEVGIHFDEASYKKIFGLRFPEMIQAIAPNTPEDVQTRIKQLKVQFYKENLALVRPNDGLLQLAQSCASTHKLALVTTASKANVMNLLQYFEVSDSLFDLIVTGEDVAKGKPDPECYQIALQRLNNNPEEACIFEDSAVGIEAAERAGAHVVKVAL